MIEELIGRLKKAGHIPLMGEPATYDLVVQEMAILDSDGFALIPDEYIDFLTETANGFAWNGRMFYGTQPLKNEQGIEVIDDLYSANQYWNCFDELYNKLVLGACDDDLYVFDADNQIYEILDRCGRDALETYPTFGQLFAGAVGLDRTPAKEDRPTEPLHPVAWEPRWEIPEHNNRSQIVSIINEMNDFPLFDLDSTSVKTTAVPFYEDYQFMVVTGFSSIPPLTMHFFIKDLDIIKLNGDSESFEEINNKARKTFNSYSIREYIRLHMKNVETDEGNIRIAETIDEVEFSSDPTPEQYEELKNVIEPMAVSEKDGGFLVEAVILHGSDVIKAKIQIDKEGPMEVLEEDLLLSDMPVRPIMLK
jgi:hypothetical protein